MDLVPCAHLHSLLEILLMSVFNVKQEFYSYSTQTTCGLKTKHAQMPSHNWSLNFYFSFLLKRSFLVNNGEKDISKIFFFPSTVILLTLSKARGKKYLKLKISFLTDILKCMYMCVYPHTRNHTCTYNSTAKTNNQFIFKCYWCQINWSQGRDLFS